MPSHPAASIATRALLYTVARSSGIATLIQQVSALYNKSL